MRGPEHGETSFTDIATQPDWMRLTFVKACSVRTSQNMTVKKTVKEPDRKRICGDGNDFI